MARWLSIRTALTGVIMGVTFLCVGVSMTVLSVQRLHQIEEELIATTATVARAAGEYVVPSLVFGDRQDASDALLPLRELPDVRAAALYDSRGMVFAELVTEGAVPLPRTAPPVPTRQLVNDRVLVVLPVASDGRVYGAIAVRSSAAALAAKRRAYFVTLAVLLGILLLLATGIAVTVQRFISRPILRLAGVAERVAGGESPGELDGGGLREIGTLADGMRVMIEQLDGRARALQESHGALQTLIEASPLAIIGLDGRGIVALWNPAAAHIFARSAADVEGRPVEEVLGDAELREVCARGLKGETVADCELSCTLAGEERSLLVSTAPLEGSVQGAEGAVVIITDVTQRRRAERSLVEREAQLQRAQKLEAVGRLAAGVSHDFNNLLTVVMASTSLLGRRLQGDAASAEHVANISAAAERGAGLARRLLAFSKSKSSRLVTVDLNQVVSDLEKMMRSILGEAVELRLDLIERPLPVDIDVGQLEQVLLNLVLNARDAMPRGGRLTVRTEAVSVARAVAGRAGADVTGRWGRISISDTGVGMDGETLARALDPFFTTKDRGTGLGLSMAADIVHGLGGDLSLESEQGQGTTVNVWLPETDGPGGDRARPAPPRLVGGRETILLVEDEPAVRAATRALLEDSGYRVIEAEDGAAAARMCRTGELAIDVVLTDVVMPRMSGPELASELAARYPDVPVVYMSGYVDESLAPHGLDIGAAALVQKPFSPDELLGAVRQALRHALARQP